MTPAASDRAEALLAARDVDGLDETPPSPDELDLVERVRAERQRTRTIRRSVVICAVALLVIVAALIVARQRPREPLHAASSSDDRVATTSSPKSVASAPRPDAALPERVASARASLPERTVRSRSQARSTAGRATAQAPSVGQASPATPATTPASPAPETNEPAPATPRTMPRPPDVRIEVRQTPSEGAVDYRVRVFEPGGARVNDADVRLRGLMADGTLVEARLEPAGEPGVYHSLLAFSARGPRALTVRVARAGGVVEIPVGEGPAAR